MPFDNEYFYKHEVSGPINQKGLKWFSLVEALPLQARNGRKTRLHMMCLEQWFSAFLML